MGAGISEKQANGYKRRLLLKLMRELQEAGVPCHYSRYEVRNGEKPITVENPSLPVPPGPWFLLEYHHGHMSNGESYLSPWLEINVGTGAKTELVAPLEFEKGLERVKELFGVPLPVTQGA